MSAPARLRLDAIGQTSIVIRDDRHAVVQHREAFGMRFPFSTGLDLAFFGCGGIRRMLGPASQRRDLTGK